MGVADSVMKSDKFKIWNSDYFANNCLKFLTLSATPKIEVEKNSRCSTSYLRRWITSSFKKLYINSWNYKYLSLQIISLFYKRKLFAIAKTLKWLSRKSKHLVLLNLVQFHPRNIKICNICASLIKEVWKCSQQKIKNVSAF